MDRFLTCARVDRAGSRSLKAPQTEHLLSEPKRSVAKTDGPQRPEPLPVLSLYEPTLLIKHLMRTDRCASYQYHHWVR